MFLFREMSRQALTSLLLPVFVCWNSGKHRCTDFSCNRGVHNYSLQQYFQSDSRDNSALYLIYRIMSWKTSISEKGGFIILENITVP
jgi:hypothetical protein